MTDEEELQRAVDAAEAGVRALEAQLEELTERRRALSARELEELLARREGLTFTLRSLLEEEQALEAELARLEQQLARPGFRLPSMVVTPLTWFLRSGAFVVYGGSLMAAHRYLQSPGLVLGLLVALPVAFVLVMVAGSLRESGAEGAPGGRAGQAEEPARLPAVDERAVAPPGGPGEHRGPHLGAGADREGDDGGG